jgi:glycosyltransferase involved in cell wall biosynthesis
MNVLIFSGDYWPDSGGIAAHVRQVSRALARREVRVTVVGGHVLPLPLGPARQTPSSPNLRVIAIRRTGPRGVRLVWFLVRAYWQLRGMASQEWDVVHFHNFVPDGLLLGLRRWPKAKGRILTNHSDILLRAVDQGRSLAFFRLLSRSVDGVIAPSRELEAKSRLILRDDQLSTYIPNGVDVDLFTPGDVDQEALRGLGVDRTAKVVLAVRRHDPKCGLDLLMRAVPAVASAHPEVRICLIGDGPETSTLKNLAADLGVEGWVRFVGYVQHDRLPPFYRSASLSVLPSVYEAVSLSGLESLACATPVVGTSVGGIPEFVKHGQTGLLVEPGSPAGLADAINDLLDRPDLRGTMGIEGRRVVMADFSWDRVASDTLDFYRQVLESRDTGAG